VAKLWTLGPTRYRRRAGGGLEPLATRNPRDTSWVANAVVDDHYVKIPAETRDRQYRRIEGHNAVDSSASLNGGARYSLAELHAVGTFDPSRLRGFDPRSALPLETYAGPALTARDARTRALLGGAPLGPDGNIGGYIAQPPLLLTTLSGARALLSSRAYDGMASAAPISAVRVRVAGVRGPDAVSRERIRQAALRIAQRTHLDVDITVGSSPAPQAVDLPAGRLGRPALALTEPWVEKNVAATILSAIDRKSLVLFALILVVCALFVANAASAAVRARRTELGLLACLGWPTSRLFAVVLGEVGVVGVVAGVLGAALALPIASAADVDASPARAALAVPAAALLALLAGLAPAVRAARAAPIEAVRPVVSEVRRARRPRSVRALALADLMRVPGRTALGALSVGIGVCALTLLLAATLAFHDTLVGTLLGDAIAVQVRMTDYVAVVATVLLGAAAAADVLFLNLRERATELATLRATGWDERAMTRLVGWEGALLGALGSLVGGALGLAAAAAFAGELPAGLVATTAGAAAVGTALAVTASLAPAAWLRRLPAVPLLAAD
jgi:putative ABC transport system permease protein